MEVQDIISALEQDPEFKKWNEANPKHYLAHVFCMMDTDEPQGYDVGFFDSENQKMTSFNVSADLKSIASAGDSEVFKEPGSTIKELDMSKVKISPDSALETAKGLQADKYSQHRPFKKVVILQHLDEGQVWNITFITQTFKTLNMKIDADSGEVVDDKIVDIIQMGK